MPVTRRTMRNAAKWANAKLQEIMAEDELDHEDFEKSDKGTDSEEVAATANSVVLGTQKPARQIFETFETAAPVTGGHCFIRPLGNGKYEVLTFDSVGTDVFGSMEFGRIVRDDSTGGRMKALEDVSKTWKDAELKVDQALRSASLRIFRFLKLPIELRFQVYDLTLRRDKTLYHGSYKYSNEHIIGGIHLTGTCRQIYEETRSLFWRNNFRISDDFKPSKRLAPLLTENLREVTWSWWAFKMKDPHTLRMLKACKKLKIFHLRLTRFCVYTGNDFFNSFSRPQYLHQEEPAVAKFKRSHGFDQLLSLRGLEAVTVTNDTGRVPIAPENLSEEEVKAFESFLNKILTQPEQPKLIKSEAVKGSKKRPVKKGGSAV